MAVTSQEFGVSAPLRFENPPTPLKSFPQKTPKDPSTTPIICTSNEIPTSEIV